MNKILFGDAIEMLKTLDSESVDVCVTSPPYYGLRDYGVSGQIGLEETPEEYIERLTAVFREVRRVLKKDGTLWVVIADSYSGFGKGAALYPDNAKKYKQGTNRGMVGAAATIKSKTPNIKPKNLIGIPWLLAFSLREDGWFLRDDIIWAKPNPMPESVKDRCTKSYEHIFMLSKSAHYYFDGEAIAEPVAESTVQRLSQDIEHQSGSSRAYGKTNGAMKAAAPRYGGKKYTETPDKFNRTKSGNLYKYRPRRNKRNVWTITTKPYKGAHFATFPPDLIEPCILAGSRTAGVVLDPFLGSGTTAAVAVKLNRQYIGIELNNEYESLIQQRIEKQRRLQLNSDDELRENQKNDRRRTGG